MYRSQMTQELTGVPSKQEIRDFIKTVLFFYQVANEEHLVDSLIQEGAKCIDEKKLDDALHLFEEALALEKWRDLYGPLILSNLAYICVQKKNYVKGKQYVDDYLSLYGSSDYSIDADEHLKMTFALDAIEEYET
jgi:outer membrane protein assembly factor BamD (BamD/ComL family)